MTSKMIGESCRPGGQKFTIVVSLRLIFKASKGEFDNAATRFILIGQQIRHGLVFLLNLGYDV